VEKLPAASVSSCSPDPVLVDLHEAERPGGGVAREGGYRVIAVAHDVDVGPVGRGGDTASDVQPVNSPHPVLVEFDEGKRPGGRVPREGGHGVVDNARDVDVGPVGGDRDTIGAV
jgi:hypothetical protein